MTTERTERARERLRQAEAEAVDKAKREKAVHDDFAEAAEQLNGAGRKRKANGTGSGAFRAWDAGDDQQPPPPRGWLLGNTFCRRFASSLIADGGVGKTALRYCQLLSLAIGRSLTGEHVFQRCRILIVSLEDDADELRRRVLAAMLHHGVSRDDVKGWLFLAAPGAAAGKLAVADSNGGIVESTLASALRQTIVNLKIDVVSLDPFVKAHGVDENSNNAIDAVMKILTDMATIHDLAVDLPHHVNKGLSDPGNSNRGRGASAMKDAARLVYTLNPMSPDEAEAFGITEAERRRLVRMDSGKVNIAPPMNEAKWFRLVGVTLGNGSDLYPHGDEVQTVELWTPPDTWAGISNIVANAILDEIEAGLPDGNRYSDHHNVADDRAAWRIVAKHVADKSEGQAKQIIGGWVKSGVLIRRDYENPVTRKPVKGLFVNAAKRPS